MNQHHSFRRLTAMTAAAIAIALTGAAQAQIEGSAATPESLARSAGLATLEHGAFDRLFLRPGADLASYHQVLIAPVQVSIERDRDELELDDRTVRHAKDEFSKELARAFGQGRTAAAQGPGVAVLELTVTELTPNNPVSPRRTPGGIIHRSFGVGSAAFQATVRDGASGEVIAVIADADQGLPFSSNMHLRTEFGDADRFISRWSKRIASLFEPRNAS